ncbi:hypothetical protein [Methanobacterium oryzae]|uniref:hypothetical protein n=1 Tax=Methanobacterium oryzae TaxID=69540 RepID=UPI003D22AA0A
MTLPSLYKDYKKYLDMEKDPTKGHVDISHMNFIAPASLLPAISFAEKYSIEKYKTYNEETNTHLDKILGRSESNSNLLPLLDVNLEKNHEKRDGYLNKLKIDIRNLLFPASPFPAGINYSYYGGTDTFPYVIGQIIDNIKQHSNAKRVYSYSQKYPNEGQIDVGILDNGDTIPGKYEQARDKFYNENDINPYEVKNDCEAIFRSMNGISTKEIFKRSRLVRFAKSADDILNSDALSFGINSSIRLITEGLGGSFLIASRKGIFHMNNRIKQFEHSKDPFDGTFVCIRFNREFLNPKQYQKIVYNYNKINDDDGKFNLVS